MWKIAIAISSLTLLTSCSKTVYIKTKCPYIEPVDVVVRTNSAGGLDRNDTAKVFKALRYYKRETIRLKEVVSAISQDKD